MKRKKIMIEGDPFFAVSFLGTAGEKFLPDEKIAVVGANGQGAFRIVQRVIDQGNDKCIVELI